MMLTFSIKIHGCLLGAPTTFALMNSTKSLRPCCAAQCIGVKPFSYLTGGLRYADHPAASETPSFR